MRKILSLLGILTLSSTTVLPVVACKTNDDHNPSSKNIPVNDQVKKWATKSSVVTKSLLTSKQQNINTNNLLNDTLKNNTNHIKHDINNTTDGNSYQDFTNDWGYNKTITGNVGDKNFVDNTVTTAADNFNSIKSTLSTIQTFLPTIKDLDPTNTVTLLNLGKTVIEPLLLQLVNKDSAIDITSLLPTVGGLIDSLKGFDPESNLTVNGVNYYKNADGDIGKTILGPNLDGKDGWFVASGYDKKSEAATTNNVVANLFTKDNISKITTWDSFFIAKTSIEISDLFKTANKTFFGDYLNTNAIIYDNNGKLTGINNTQLLIGLLGFIQADPIKLISLLIPTIKWQILGFSPTTTINSITDGPTPSNPTTGILNINDVMKTVKKLISSPENFADFLISLLSANKDNQGIFSDVVINTAKDSNPTTFTQAMETSTPFHDAISNELKALFPMFAKYLTQYKINDWLDAIIKSFTADDKLNIDFIDFSNRIKSLSNSKDLIAALDFIKKLNKDTIDSNWNKILTLLGVTNDGKNPPTFALDSPLGMILDFLKSYEPTIETILTNVTSTIDTYVQEIYTSVEKIIDFNNDNKLWTTTVDHCTYDSKTQQSMIFYTLINGTNVYQVVSVINGDASQNIGANKSQIWIKDITL